jgi:DNA-binding CsgD family transcriptional regulator
LISLYRLASSAPASQFQELALAETRQAIDFDSAFWAAGAIHETGPRIHSVYRFRQPPEMMESWEKLKQHDTILMMALAQPGRTVRATALGPEGGEPFVPEVVAHARQYGMEHVLGTVLANVEIGLLEGVAIYRADKGRPFSDVELLLKQNLLPHLVEAWSINRLASVTPERRQANPMRIATAICDQTGLLYSAGPDLAVLLQQEWPGWHGPLLPAQLRVKMGRHVGEQIVVSIEEINDLWLLRVRQRQPIDQLSQRELDVARRFAEGRSYHEIAGALYISPATVRNHLKNIYAKLGISDKAALANLVRRN